MSDPNARAGGGLSPFDPSIDHFARLGLIAGMRIDRDQLESNYLERSKLVHPDGFVTQPSAVQRLAMEHSAALNSAYAVVRDATARAEYLVKLGGIDLDSSDPDKGAPQPTQAFLMDMIERREALDEAKSAGVDALEDQRDLVDDERAAQLAHASEALDQGDTEAAARALIAARYLARLIEELEHAVEALV